MRTVPFALDGQEYHLLLNGAALFDIYDRFGGEGSVLDHVRGGSRASFEALCWYLEKLCTQGELLRRYEGRDKGPIPAADMFRTCLSPLDVPRARLAIHAAVAAGFGREEAERREVDKGLLELEKKTGAGSPGPNT